MPDMSKRPPAAFGTRACVVQESVFCLTTSVEDGVQALALATTTAYQLVITDYEMPRMNGADLCRQFRLNVRHVATPIILCSGVIANLDTEALQKEIGLMTFVPKPLDLVTFTDLLRGFATIPSA